MARPQAPRPSERWTVRARRELDRALDWYLAENPQAAQDLGDELLTVLAVLRESPERWPICRQPAIRRYVFQRFPYLLFYTCDDDRRVTIVAFLHQHQDLTRRFQP